MLLGEYAHTVDEKGRFTMPTKLREALRDGFVITKGLDGCLYMYNMEQWHILEDKLATLPMSNKNARDFVRFFVSGALDSSYDRQGRVLLPQNLRDFARLEKDIVIAGAGTHAEIWNAEDWNKKQTDLVDNVDNLAEQMTDFGI